MSKENLRLFTTPTSQSPDQELNLGDFDFKNLGTDLVGHILRLQSPNFESIKTVDVVPLAKGFNLEITGGGIYKVSVSGNLGQPDHNQMILKAIPPFVEQQQAMFEALDKIGQKAFIDLLAQYPSNRLSQRELSTYAFLASEIPILTPTLLFGILNELTEQAWIFMEDLSALTTVTADIFSWNEKSMSAVIKQIADFHATFWAKDLELNQQSWIGDWWTNRHNDFVAEDVTVYALETCLKLHPDLLTPTRYAFIANVLKNRASLHSLFQEQAQTLIHWDMGPHNMKLDQKRQLNQLAVFDWELTSVGVAQWDLAQFIMPILGGKDERQIIGLIDQYLSFLTPKISGKINRDEFLKIFDLVVLDHFFRVCGPIVFANGEIDDSNVFFREWKHCLEWIDLRLIKGSQN